MLHVYFMRHGETAWNTVKRLQGTTDIPLNENGIALARAVSQAVHESNIHFEYVFTSPLVRARKTAELMSQYSPATVQADERISEFCFGEAEGVTLADIKRLPQFAWICDWFLAPERYQPQAGAESYEHFFSRLQNFLDSLRALDADPENDGKSVLIVCHGGVVRWLVHCMTGDSLAHFADVKIPNCGVNLATLSGGNFTLEYTAKVFATAVQ